MCDDLRKMNRVFIEGSERVDKKLAYKRLFKKIKVLFSRYPLISFQKLQMQIDKTKALKMFISSHYTTFIQHFKQCYRIGI